MSGAASWVRHTPGVRIQHSKQPTQCESRSSRITWASTANPRAVSWVVMASVIASQSSSPREPLSSTALRMSTEIPAPQMFPQTQNLRQVDVHPLSGLNIVLMTLRMPLLALALACGCTHTPEPTTPGAEPASEPSGEAPEHLALIVDDWTQGVFRKVKVAAAQGRGSFKRELRWTQAERAELEQTRTVAREAITRASSEDQPWLLAAYVGGFAYYGIGAEWADAILDIPPEHPVWSGSLAWCLLDALEESREPARLRAYVHAAAAVHDAPLIDAQSIYLHLEDADRAGEWARARDLYAGLVSIQIPWGRSTSSGTAVLDIADQLDPDRALRADKQVPNYCGPAILGPHAGTRVCLDQQFPHEQPTLIIGWATWCGPCVEQLPGVIELVRDQPLRVIAISYDEDAELARRHLHELGIDDWTVMLPRAERPLPADAVGLDFRPIPFLALVDAQGKVEAGPPWLDREALAGRLR